MNESGGKYGPLSNDSSDLAFPLHEIKSILPLLPIQTDLSIFYNF